MQEPYIRSTIADRELESWIVVDRSPSIDFGTADCEKADLALAAAAAIGFLTDHAGNRLGSVLLEPGGERMFPPRGGKRHLQSLLHTLATSDRVELGRSTWPAVCVDCPRSSGGAVSSWSSPTSSTTVTGSGACACWPCATRCSRSRSSPT